MVIHEGETLADIKVRIQQKLQVPDDEFAKVRFFKKKKIVSNVGCFTDKKLI